MKFHCDRCNKPYVIADERVRGKILKIRCKSCSAIITVRERMDSIPGDPASPPARAASAGGRAATPQPGVLAPEGPPIDPDLEPEWYLSVGGKQDGPLSLVDAKEWISGQDADAEVYCWRDGFDDWRLVEEVPFFQKVRRRRQSKLILVPPPPHVEDAAAERLSSQSIVWSGVSQSSADLQLEVDEPSRVVSLKTLAATRDVGAGMTEGPTLPGVDDDGDAAFAPAFPGPALPGEAAASALPAPRRRSVVPLMIVVALMVVVAVGLALWVTRRGADDAGQTAPQTSGRTKLENLGYRVDPAARRPADEDGAAGSQDQAADGSGGAARGPRIAAGTRRRDMSREQTGAASAAESAGSGAGSGEAPGSGATGGAVGPLTPDDIIRESARSEMGFRRCYERARKNDPFLSIKSLEVNLSVSPAGEVTEVTLSDQQDSYLGQCIAARIRKWQFRASTEGIKSQIPLVFEQQ